MLPQAPSYEELTARFRWQVPEHYNIGVDACDRWADTDRLALIHLDADGREARYSFRDLQRLSNRCANVLERSEEHTSELKSLMRISYAVFCLKKKKQQLGKAAA